VIPELRCSGHIAARCGAYRIALKLRRAEERFTLQSTRAASFKRLLGGMPLMTKQECE